MLIAIESERGIESDKSFLRPTHRRTKGADSPKADKLFLFPFSVWTLDPSFMWVWLSENTANQPAPLAFAALEMRRLTSNQCTKTTNVFGVFHKWWRAAGNAPATRLPYTL